MNWINNINTALKFIEENLESDLTNDDIASKACSSKFHFLRSFNMLTGKTLSEYIKERRLTKAGKELVTTNEKIIDIALRFAYQTPEAFSKAFKRYHGVTPSTARNNGNLLTVTPPLQINVSLKGDSKINYTIEKKEAFKITGISREISFENAEKEIRSFHKELLDNGSFDKMIELSSAIKNLRGVSYAYNYDEGNYRYLFGIHLTNESIDIFNEVVEIPESHWAIFKGQCHYNNYVEEAWKKIFEEWFPATGYSHASLPELESSWPTDEEGVLNWETSIPIIKS